MAHCGDFPPATKGRRSSCHRKSRPTGPSPTPGTKASGGTRCFILLGLRIAGLQPTCEVNRHGLVQKARARIEEQSLLPLGRAISGFLQQFPLRAGQSLFPTIDAASRQFPKIIVSRVTVLALQQNARFGAAIVHRKNYGRPGMPYHVTASGNSAWLAHAVGAHAKGRPLEDGFRREDLDFLRPTGWLFRFAAAVWLSQHELL